MNTAPCPWARNDSPLSVPCANCVEPEAHKPTSDTNLPMATGRERHNKGKAVEAGPAALAYRRKPGKTRPPIRLGPKLINHSFSNYTKITITRMNMIRNRNACCMMDGGDYGGDGADAPPPRQKSAG